MGRIVLEQVKKAFGDTLVIPPLDLEINDGEFVVFVGPSGCGKSTLLRLIAGLEDVTEGIVPYLNRLSDVLFVLARFLNARRGIEDPEWRPAGS